MFNKLVPELEPVQLVPFDEYATVFVPDPVATHNVPPRAMPWPILENVEVPSPDHVIPSFEVAIVCCVPEPTTTHFVPFHAACCPDEEKIDVPKPVHVTPSREYANVLVPEPPATNVTKSNVKVALLVYAVLLYLSRAQNLSANEPAFAELVLGVMVNTLVDCEMLAVLPTDPEVTS